MFVQQFYVPSLGHYSYLIGDTNSGEALVVDPKRDIKDYLKTAQYEGLRIKFIFETHNHNDYVSGSRELAAATGAPLFASTGSGIHRDFQPVKEGDEIQVGCLKVRVMATPGHTPEHVSYTVADTTRTDAPALVLTGGDLLVGSVGRPDLLGPELGAQLAPKLYDSLHGKILKLEDYVQVLPTHGAGSSCGNNISTTRTSTIGYEKRFNEALQQPTQEAFIEFVLREQPAIPAYYSRMRLANQQGPAVLGKFPELKALTAGEVQKLTGEDCLLIDTRSPAAFGGGHIAGSYNIGLGGSFTTWVGSVIGPNKPLIFLLQETTPQKLAEIVTQLVRIGYEKQLYGYLVGGFEAWLSLGFPIEHLAQISVQELAGELKQAQPKDQQPGWKLTVLDVRSDMEWASGHIEGAFHIPGGELEKKLDQLALDKEQPLAVICGSGYRSSVAVSILQRHGFSDLQNTIGGMSAWKAAKLPTTN